MTEAQKKIVVRIMGRQRRRLEKVRKEIGEIHAKLCWLVDAEVVQMEVLTDTILTIQYCGDCVDTADESLDNVIQGI